MAFKLSIKSIFTKWWIFCFIKIEGRNRIISFLGCFDMWTLYKKKYRKQNLAVTYYDASPLERLKIDKYAYRQSIKPGITGLLQKSHEVTKTRKLYYYQIMNGLLTKFFGPWNDYFTYTKHIISSSQRSHPAASLLFVLLSLHNNNKLKNELECYGADMVGRVWLQRERCRLHRYT